VRIKAKGIINLNNKGAKIKVFGRKKNNVEIT